MKLEVPGLRDESPLGVDGIDPLGMAGYGELLGARVVDAVDVRPAARGARALTTWGDVRELAATSPEDCVELEFEGGLVEIVAASGLDARLGLLPGRAGAGPGLMLPLRWPPPVAAERGAADFVLKAARHLRLDPLRAMGGRAIADSAVRLALPAVVQALERKLMPEPGLYRVERSFQLAPRPEGNLDPGRDILVLLHGTASSSRGSFGDLAGSEEWSRWQDRFQVVALEHHTLGRSPARNALDLVSALPEGSTLRLLAHSRGGLVGELICCGATLAAEDLDLFLPGEELRELREELTELKSTLAERRLRVERFARVACPAAGTLLAGRRLDRWLNAFLNLIGLHPALRASGLYAFAKAVVVAVVSSRERADVLPGLAAMLPWRAEAADGAKPRGHGLIPLLNSSPPSEGRELGIIAGDAQGGGPLGRLKTFFADLYFGEDHDFVVDSRSMLRGVPRAGARFVLDRGPQVDHFSYFANPHTRLRTSSWLAGDEPSGLEPLPEGGVPGRARGPLADKGAWSAPVKNDPRPVVFLVPGVMGSHLSAGNDHIWIHVLNLIRGRLRRLGRDASNVRAFRLVERSYQELYRFLSATCRVEPFPFDWRRSVAEAGSALAAAIEAELAAGKAVRIVAHSMGGLVARAVHARHRDVWDGMRERGGRLLMLGTPNRGSYSIPRILYGQESSLHYLAVVDAVHGLDEVIDLVKDFPGLLEMLPEALLQGFAWPHLALGRVPEAEAVEQARRVRAALATAVDPDGMLYVAGRKDLTAAELSVETGKVRFRGTRRGDGTVTWESGLLEGVPAWFVDCGHGDLARHRPSFEGFRELLETGRTARLASQPPAELRGVARLVEMPEAPAEEALRLVPDDAELTASILDLSPAAACPAAPRTLGLALLHGDLREVRGHVLVGHYQGDPIVSAEAVLDRGLGGRLRRDHSLGHYPGGLGTAAVYEPEPGGQAPGAVVVGLGRVGSLNRERLLETVTGGLLSLVLSGLDRSEAAAGEPAEVTVTSVLIGQYGGSSIDTYTSLGVLIEAALRVNRQLEEKSEGSRSLVERVRIGRLEAIEIFEDVATQAAHDLAELASRPLYPLAAGERLEAEPILRSLRGGRSSRPASPHSGGWPRRVEIVERARDRALVFRPLSGLARSEKHTSAVQWSLIEGHLERAVDNDRAALRTLFHYLLPSELAGSAREREDVVLNLDAAAARLPWELLDPYGGDEAPIGAGIGIVRTLRTGVALRDRRRPEGGLALVIGEPAGVEPPLPGARHEAEEVGLFLRQRGYDVHLSLAAGRDDILDDLYAGEYDILHIAGHGSYDPGDPRSSGVLLSDGFRLTAIELEKMRAVPTLVFLNCCHLARLDRRASVSHPGGLAASLARTLIEMGVNVVVAAGWAVDDRAAVEFATGLYDQLLSGRNLLWAAREARKAAYVAAPGSTTWGAYHVYGDPGFTLPGRGGASPAVAGEGRPCVARHELLAALADRAREAAGAGAADRARLGQALADLERATPAAWLDGEVLAAFGMAWAALVGEGAGEDEGCWFEKARDALEQALRHTGTPLRAVEQLANLLDRRAARALDPAASSRAVDLLGKLLAIAPSVERLSLLGGARKRQALVAVRRSAKTRTRAAKGGRAGKPCAAAQASLAAAREAYARAAELAGERHEDYYYPALNQVACSLLLGEPAPGLEPTMRRAAASAAELEGREKKVWARIALADVELYRFLVRPRRRKASAVVEGYARAFRAGVGATPRERSSVREQIEALRDLAAGLGIPAAFVDALDEVLAEGKASGVWG